ncbi:MAG: hypothetical protein KAU02_01180 [Tenericutes bacterium]|nr:hypothetical protein [Mycoplasmatota bacterium]
MRILTKRFLITFLSVFLGLGIVACSNDTEITTPNDSKIPNITNPDEIYISTDNFNITYGDLYEELKRNDGLNQLLMMVDSDLISSYVSAVTETELANKIIEMTYGTDDEEDIAELSIEDKADLEKSFNDSMYLLGYGDNPNDYVKIIVAREKYAEAQLSDVANVEESWYASPSVIASEYTSDYYDDIRSIKIGFASESEANATLRNLNLVSKDGDLLLYIGATPLEDVPSNKLDETNTRSLTDAELLNKFLIMYNQNYGAYNAEVDEDSTYTEVLAMDDFVHEYDELTSFSLALTNFVYKTLGTYQNVQEDVDDTPFYTYAPVRYIASTNSYYFMILNLDRTDKVDLSDFDGDAAALEALIGTDKYNEILNDANEANLNSSNFANYRMAELREEHGFEIYDYYLALDYMLLNLGFEGNAEGSETIIVKYDDAEITADQLLTYSMNKNAPISAIYAAQSIAVFASHFEDLYCDAESECEFDISKNESDLITQHIADMETQKAEFQAGYYSTYYSYDEYIYLAYGVHSETELLSRLFVNSTIRPYYIYDAIRANDYEVLETLLTLVQPYYDNYFSLEIEHLLIYVDRDENASPDNYDDFYEGLSDTTEYDQKLLDFTQAIRDYLDVDDNSIISLRNEYDEAKSDDPTWGEFINYGFYVKFEALGDKTYKEAEAIYEEVFVDGLIDIYQVYLEDENINEDYIYGDELIQSSYGVHLIKVSKGDDFDRPSGLFEMEYDATTGDPLYLPELVNENEAFTLDQLKVYADYRFASIVAETGDLEAIYGLVKPEMPEELEKAFDMYFGDLYDAYYVIGYLNTIIGAEILAGEYTNENPSYCTMSEAEFDVRIQNMKDIYMYQIFADYDKGITE